MKPASTFIGNARVCLAGLVFAALASGPAHAQGIGEDIRMAGEVVDVRAQEADDVMAAGRRVRVSGSITDNLLAAGRNVTLDAVVGGDALMVGQDVRVAGRVARNLFAAGQDVSLSAPVEGDVFAAAGAIILPEDASVGGDVTLAAGEVLLAGPVGGNARLAGGDVRIDGTVAGDVDAAANKLALGPSARIEGRLTVRSPEPPDVADGATIAGGLQHIVMNAERAGRPNIGDLFGFWLATTLIAWLVGIILFAVAPGVARAAAAELRSHPLATFLLGFAIALLGLPLAILMAVTVVGMPFAFVTFGAWLFAVSVAVPALALALAIRHAERRSEDPPRFGTIALPLAVILGVIVAVGMIPVAGQLLLAIAAFFGIGTLGQAVTAARRRWRGAPAYA